MPHRNPEQAKSSRKNHYEKNKQKYLDRNAKRVAEFRAVIKEARTKPCADCGYYHEAAMDFDHLSDKSFTIAQVNKISSMEKLKAEIAKCEVVCANCHRIRTWQRRSEMV